MTTVQCQSSTQWLLFCVLLCLSTTKDCMTVHGTRLGFTSLYVSAPRLQIQRHHSAMVYIWHTVNNELFVEPLRHHFVYILTEAWVHLIAVVHSANT